MSELSLDETNTITLYKSHGKSVGWWSVSVCKAQEEGTGRVMTGYLINYARKIDGAVTERFTETVSKNVGKANETTPWQQAESEALSRARKQLDKGYTVTMPEAGSESTNTLGFTKPMLAQPADKVDESEIDWDTAYLQPKLDGHRAMFKDGVLYSRGGKVIDMPHITRAIEENGLADLHLDGELYLHEKSLQEISRLVKKPSEDSLELTFWIYDQVSPKPWIERLEEIADTTTGKNPAATVLHFKSAEDMEDVLSGFQLCLAAGYEGTMLRWGTKGYEAGKRSKNLLKFKDFKDAEFIVVDGFGGKPHITEEGTYQVAVFICETEDGKRFNVTAPGNRTLKHQQWEHMERFFGKELTVKYHYLSADGIPQLPVALRWREDI